MIWEDNGFTLSSGRHVYANIGIVGIRPDLEISEGYDSQIHMGDPNYDGDPVWTQAERRELAEAMIALWQRFGGIEP